MKQTTRKIGAIAVAAGAGGAVALAWPAAAGEWVSFVDETAARLLSAPNLGAADSDIEKDYAWGDFDQDGDVDLVVARKSIGSTPGHHRNVLFMNEGVAEGHAMNGVLIDRSEEYATAATHASSDGFLDPTNDRDVMTADLDGDGWLDLVTATTYGQLNPQHITHPRVYINLGEIDGEWQGFEFDHTRIPAFSLVPNFCAVGVGDVDGNGLPDLYFADYHNNLEDRLLMNNGSGTFIDQTELRTFGDMVTSTFSSQAWIADMNGDGKNDIVKSSSLQPYRVTVAYNNGPMEGFFTQPHFQIATPASAYFVSVADLNNDGMLDLIETDDSVDFYMLNQGNQPISNHAEWTIHAFPNSDSFGSHSIAADLNNDGFKDVLIADVDVEILGCQRRLKIYRNNANPPNVTFVEDTGDIPHGMLTGSFHTAVFDIDGNGWNDIVVGRCSGTQVWMNQGDGSPPACPADLDASGEVNAADLAQLLGSWGSASAAADLDGSGVVNAADLAILLGSWGPCA